MGSMFQKVDRSRVFLKLAVMGPSGSGKTYSALFLAAGLADGGDYAILDTENGSGMLYMGKSDYNVTIDGGYAVLEPPFQPKKYIEAIKDAEANGIKVLVIDSLTHAWKNILDQKETLDKNGGNSFTNWGKVKPQYEELVNTILQAQMHIIVCYRAKDEYVLEDNGKGKSSPKKVGMGAIAEPGSEYEHTVVWSVGMSHKAEATKDRTGLFKDEIEHISPETGKRLLAWLNEAPSQEVARPAAKPQPVQATGSKSDASAYLDSLGVTGRSLNEFIDACKAKNLKASEFALFAKEKGVNDLIDLYQLLNEQEQVSSEANGRSDDQPTQAADPQNEGRFGHPGIVWLRDVLRLSAEEMKVYKAKCTKHGLDWRDNAERLSSSIEAGSTAFDALMESTVAKATA